MRSRAAARRYHTLPQPSVSDLQTLSLRRLPFDLGRLANRYGSVFALPLGGLRGVVVGDPTLAAHVLAPRHAGTRCLGRLQDPSALPFAGLGELLGASDRHTTIGVFFGNGEHWSRPRRALERGLDATRWDQDEVYQSTKS